MKQVFDFIVFGTSFLINQLDLVLFKELIDLITNYKDAFALERMRPLEESFECAVDSFTAPIRINALMVRFKAPIDIKLAVEKGVVCDNEYS